MFSKPLTEGFGMFMFEDDHLKIFHLYKLQKHFEKDRQILASKDMTCIFVLETDKKMPNSQECHQRHDQT